MEHTLPDVYNAYLGHTAGSSSAQKLLPTTILLDASARHGSRLYEELSTEGEPGRTTRPHQRIVCSSEPEQFSGFQSSFVSLWMLQVIVALSILACVVEGVYLGLKMLSHCDAQSEVQESEKGGLGLSGSERLLLAIPSLHGHVEVLFSPGVEKKRRAYESTRYFVKQAACGRREFIAYDEEDDDEANRPVM
ncbi:hypothetical protein ACN47E_006326 [Coniothyrium glycines]